MFDKYFCRKFHAKEITLRMLGDEYFSSRHPSVLIAYWALLTWACLHLYDISNAFVVGCVVISGCVVGIILSSLFWNFDVLEHITVATCPLKK